MQVKIFGSFTRWFQDVAAPHDGIPGRAVLTTASTALRYCYGPASPGPVHLNLQFREPLAPTTVPWSAKQLLHGLEHWMSSKEPFTTNILGGPGLPGDAGQASHYISTTSMAGATPVPELTTPEVSGLVQLLSKAQRGLLVVGELLSHADVMCAHRIGELLGWPVVADSLSGLRLGAGSCLSDDGECGFALIHHMDHLLLGDKQWWQQLRPDVVVQIGPHLTSKRLAQFMVRTCLRLHMIFIENQLENKLESSCLPVLPGACMVTLHVTSVI